MARETNQYKPSFNSNWVLPTRSATSDGDTIAYTPSQEPRLIDTPEQNLTREINTSTLLNTTVPSTRANSARGVSVQYKSTYPSNWTLHNKPITPELPDADAGIGKSTRKVNQQEHRKFLAISSNEEPAAKLNQSVKTHRRKGSGASYTTTKASRTVPWYKRFMKRSRTKQPQPMVSSTSNNSSSDESYLSSPDEPYVQSGAFTDEEGVRFAITTHKKDRSSRKTDRRSGAHDETSTVQSQKSSHAFSDLPAKQPTVCSSYSDPSRSLPRPRSGTA